MLSELNKERRKIVMEYCLERFGISNGNLENYIWYIGSKNRIYIGPNELKRIRPESIGLCIFRIDKTPKPTTNFIQLFGHLITKNAIEINENEVVDFCSGKDLKPKGIKDIEPGFVAVRNKYRNIGCGHWNGNLLKNQIPKSRFCKINFL
jgi:hypothetical protein